MDIAGNLGRNLEKLQTIFSCVSLSFWCGGGGVYICNDSLKGERRQCKEDPHINVSMSFRE